VPLHDKDEKTIMESVIVSNNIDNKEMLAE
jgi:hypothetical protein